MLQPNTSESLFELEDTILAFQSRYQQHAKPFASKYTRQDLARQMASLTSDAAQLARSVGAVKIPVRHTHSRPVAAVIPDAAGASRRQQQIRDLVRHPSYVSRTVVRQDDDHRSLVGNAHESSTLPSHGAIGS